MPGAGKHLTKALNKRLDGLAAEYSDQVQTNTENIKTAHIHRSRLSITGELLGGMGRETDTHFADIDRDTRKIIGRIKEGAGKDYYAYQVKQAGYRADIFEIRIEVASLLMIEEVVAGLDDAATKWVRNRLDAFDVEIKNTTGAIRNRYLRVQEYTASPEPVELILRDNLNSATRDGDGKPLPTYEGHLYSDRKGQFPAALNRWERAVVKTEVGRPSFVAWYRNPARATAAALRVTYQTDAGDWTSLQPDFLILSRQSNGTLGASIVDPHGDHLADAKNKLRALASYAEQFGAQYVRIASISEASDGSLRSLDLMEDSVRQAIEHFADAEVGTLYESQVSVSYK